MRIPIKPMFEMKVSSRELRQIAELAERLLLETPALDSSKDTFRHLLVNQIIGDEPTLHLDDFSEIPVIGKEDNSAVLQQRARLRAFDGDYVAISRPIEAAFTRYCETQLALGKVEWLCPQAFDSSGRDNNTDAKNIANYIAHQQVVLDRNIAFGCWKDRRIRNELVGAVRRHGLRYIHPHVSTLHVWELASYLQNATRRPFSVIGPTPGMARWANDKIEFTRTVARLLGEKFVPRTESAYNFASLSNSVNRLAAGNTRLCVKFPFGTGGSGNFLIEAQQIRGYSLKEVRSFLKQLLAGHRWPKPGRVLIDVWEQDVISSPSVQTWIPPVGEGNPIIEGLFQQMVNSKKGAFLGSSPATLPEMLQNNILTSAFRLAKLFQQLGYIGRCSFDLILIGNSIEECRYEFIECNARWGGTSTPMTLINRLNVDVGGVRTWAVKKVKVPGLERVSFQWLLHQLGSRTFNSQNQSGELVFFNPGRLRYGAIDAIAISNSSQSAKQILSEELPRSLSQSLSGFDSRNQNVRLEARNDDTPPRNSLEQV